MTSKAELIQEIEDINLNLEITNESYFILLDENRYLIESIAKVILITSDSHCRSILKGVLENVSQEETER